MHELKIIDGRLYLDEKRLCGIQEYTICVSEINDIRMCELNLKMAVKLSGQKKKAERINERLSKGEASLNQARIESGLGNVTGGDIVTIVQPDSNMELD